jgi:hypothetical protein
MYRGVGGLDPPGRVLIKNATADNGLRAIAAFWLFSWRYIADFGIGVLPICLLSLILLLLA